MKKYFYLFLFIFFCVVLKANSQNLNVENLVFEGASIRGIGYAGAISELEKNQLIPGIKRVAGTSAGAVTALLVSLGYSSEEIISIISTTNFRKFNDGNYLFAGGIN